MAKKKIQKPHREVTKRQLSHWQQQKKRQRIVFSLGILIVSAILVIIGLGWYFGYYQPLHQIVMSVGEAEFDMNYYTKTLEYYGKDQSDSYIYSLANEVEVIIARNELIKNGALTLGISISDEETDEQLNSYDPPLDTDFREMARANLLLAKLLDEHFEQEVPLAAEQRHVMALFLESESLAEQIRTRIEAGENFADLAGELSLDRYSKDENGDLDWHPEDVLTEVSGSSIMSDYVFNSEIGVLSQPIYDEEKTKNVGYWLVEVVEKQQDPEQVYIQAILLGNEEKAQDVKARLENGEDFVTLANELSLDEVSKENGGDIGWLNTEDVLPGATYAAWADIFGLETGIISDPIRDDTQVTAGGYWILNILDKDDNKVISEDDREFLKFKVMNEWILSLWDNAEGEIDIYLTDEMKLSAIERVIGR
ncbi:MAG: peptidylprolyl isomerase [Dehalococcoidales bacterium]|nr:peptidylprolyl isomerase [Dehalococcoidales bacterium]